MPFLAGQAYAAHHALPQGNVGGIGDDFCPAWFKNSNGEWTLVGLTKTETAEYQDFPDALTENWPGDQVRCHQLMRKHLFAWFAMLNAELRAQLAIDE